MTYVRPAAYRRRDEDARRPRIGRRRSRRRGLRRLDARRPRQRSIVVSGDGSVTSVPDRAQISFGVSTDARTASAALRGNAAEMAKVIAAIKGQGIAAADMRTEVVSLSPRYSQNGESIIGYQAANSVSATIRNLARPARSSTPRSRRARTR